MAEDKELQELRAENTRLQKDLKDKENQIASMQKQIDSYAASSGENANEELEKLRAKVLSLEQSNKGLQESTGIYQLNETFEHEGKTYQFAPGRRKFILKGVEYYAADAIKNPEVMGELINMGYSGLVLQEGGNNA